MESDFDLHIHGKHSGGVSPKMEIPVIAREASKKGLDLVGTGDILNPKWLRHVKKNTERRDGYLEKDDTRFLLTTEVEDENRIHHILVFPSLSSVEEAYSDFKELSNDIRREGRPRIKAEGEKIAEIAKKHDALIGPAHAFTPYTAIYGRKDSLEECYGRFSTELDFLELGLSADSSMASRLSDHENITFLSNSDAHSPWPHRLGREFNRAEMTERSFEGLEKLLHGKKGKMNMNVGLDPREGKYHCSACNSCHQKYSPEEAGKFDWSCQECPGTIKKGVKDRVNELADRKASYPVKYQNLPPLAKIIQYTVGHASPTTKTVQSLWKKFNEEHGSEIDILLEKEIETLEKTDSDVAESIKKFRGDEIVMIPGGGGEYGKRIIPSDKDEKNEIEQKRSDEINCRYREK